MKKVWSLAEEQFPKYIEILPDHGSWALESQILFQIHITCEMIKGEDSKLFLSNPSKEEVYVPDFYPHYEGYYVTLFLHFITLTTWKQDEHVAAGSDMQTSWHYLAMIQQYLMKFSEINHTF